MTAASLDERDEAQAAATVRTVSPVLGRREARPPRVTTGAVAPPPPSDSPSGCRPSRRSRAGRLRVTILLLRAFRLLREHARAVGLEMGKTKNNGELLVAMANGKSSRGSGFKGAGCRVLLRGSRCRGAWFKVQDCTPEPARFPTTRRIFEVPPQFCRLDWT